MLYVARALTVMLALGLLLQLSLAQKSMQELPEGAADQLRKEGSPQAHQGADNPRQGNRSSGQGRWGGPDPYGSEGYREFLEKVEREMNDPQWQLSADLSEPRHILISYPDGTTEEFWYVLFRVSNENMRRIRSVEHPRLHDESRSGDGSASEPLRARDRGGDEREGVPANAHLDFRLEVFTRDIERSPWEMDWPEEPEDAVLSPEALEQRRAGMKRSYTPVSDHYVLRQIAQREGMFEWMGNHDNINQPIMLLHPLSDFQRQIGRAHDLSAPDYSGPRCVAYRSIVVDAEGVHESFRYAAVYGDNTFAGFFGEGDTLPQGARLVHRENDPMWGRLSARRYQAGDCVDRFGRPLSPNEPGYLDARKSGGGPGEASSYGVLGPEHRAVGTPVQIPHVRQYRAGDRVLFGHDSGLADRERSGANALINGRIVGPGDPRYDGATVIEQGTQMFGGHVVGKPVKQVDSRGRAIRAYLVTYQPGDVLTQEEWDIYRARLGPGILSRYGDVSDIVGRALRADDPVVGLPKLKLGTFVGDREAARPEVIQRGRDTGRRGNRGEVILELEEYTTGRRYDPRRIEAGHFARDPDGEFTTNREAPVPATTGLRPGAEYIYAPLGNPGAGALPVPHFDQHGAWQDYRDDLSGARVPLRDEEGELVRDHQDQILYLKEYEYEYVYLYEYDPVALTDESFRSGWTGKRHRLVRDRAFLTRSTHKVVSMGADGQAREQEITVVLPLSRFVYESREVSEPEVVDHFRLVGEDGQVRYVTRAEYLQAAGEPPPEGTPTVKAISDRKTTEKVVVGIYADGMDVGEGRTFETWEEARQRAESAGATVEEREVIRYVERYRDDKLARRGADGPRPDEFEDPSEGDTDVELQRIAQTYSRWTVPPPLVYRGDDGEWHAITRLADRIGPATRWDGADAPRFLTRHVSEMWGVAIFRGVSSDWDYANVIVRGLRGTVANSGLERDRNVTALPNPAVGGGDVERAFFHPRFLAQNWVYRVRYERLGDQFEPGRSLTRKQRAFWYLESDTPVARD
jgi:hypothetical protein